MARRSTPKQLTRAMLLERAGRVYFARGEKYQEAGAVRELREKDGAIQAKVRGTRSYTTTLTLGAEGVDGRCSCPLGQDDEFCKHLVATGLAYIAQRDDATKPKGKAKPVTRDEVQAYLSGRDVPELVRIIMEQAAADEAFGSLLKLRAAAGRSSSDTSAMRDVLRQAITIEDFVSWRETSSYTRRVDRVLDQIRKLITPAHAEQVVELAEYGMDLWEENIGLIDDSDGCMGMIRDDLHQLHLKACRIAKPEPVSLAERLARRAIESEWDMFCGAYETYGRVFGNAGRARYRGIVEAEWNGLPRIGPGGKDPGRFGRSGTLDRMMLAIAEEGNDLDLAIRVLGRDLSSSHRYLLIAQRCRQARKYGPALEWAERGMAAFADHPDPRLRSFLAEEYRRAGRVDDAMSSIWDNFTQRPALETYQDLANSARKLECWDAWREKALAHVRADFEAAKAKSDSTSSNRRSAKSQSRYYWSSPADHSLLVEILLWEKRDDEAWAEAREGGCSNGLWLDLARRREKTHPEDAVEIYRRQVAPLVERTDNNSYREAVVFLGRIHGMTKESGEEEDFRSWIRQLKIEYKRKRNFIKYIEQKAWGR